MEMSSLYLRHQIGCVDLARSQFRQKISFGDHTHNAAILVDYWQLIVPLLFHNLNCTSALHIYIDQYNNFQYPFPFERRIVKKKR